MCLHLAQSFLPKPDSSRGSFCGTHTGLQWSCGEANSGRSWECWHSKSYGPCPTSCLQLCPEAQSWSDNSAGLVTACENYLVIRKWQTKAFILFFFSILPTPLTYWGMKTPGAIFHQCLTQCLLCRAAFPSPSSRNSTHFPAPYLFSSPLQSTISWRRTESSTWSNIKTEIFSHVYFFYKLCH